MGTSKWKWRSTGRSGRHGTWRESWRRRREIHRDDDAIQWGLSMKSYILNMTIRLKKTLAAQITNQIPFVLTLQILTKTQHIWTAAPLSRSLARTPDARSHQTNWKISLSIPLRTSQSEQPKHSNFCFTSYLRGQEKRFSWKTFPTTSWQLPSSSMRVAVYICTRGGSI